MPFSSPSSREGRPRATALKGLVMSPPKIGAKVPDFSLPATGDGGTWRLKDAKGQKVVLYFYPKDMTTGCTRESQDFRDLNAAFRKAGAHVVGVSRDSLKSHEKFREKEKLPFE